MFKMRVTLGVVDEVVGKIKVYCTTKGFSMGDITEAMYYELLNAPDSEFEKKMIKRAAINKCKRIELKVKKIMDNYKI